MTLSLPDFLYSQLERASCFPGRRPPLREAFLRLARARHCGLRRFCSPCSEGICRLGASGRRDRFNSFCDYGGKNLLGRAGTANLLAAALLRISLPRACIRRLDLDVAENSLKKSPSCS